MARLEGILDPRPVVNRNLVFEGYWQDWCDEVVGLPLNWQIERVVVDGGLTAEEYMRSLKIG